MIKVASWTHGVGWALTAIAGGLLVGGHQAEQVLPVLALANMLNLIAATAYYWVTP